jgi:hypothetical protein
VTGFFHSSNEPRVNFGRARLFERREPSEPGSRGQLREKEIVKFVIYFFGGLILPDDDYGRDVLSELLNQLAVNGVSPGDLREIGLDMLPEAGDDDTLDDMVKKIGRGRKLKADDIARRLGIDFKTRTLLDLRTIGATDVSKAEREEIAAQKEAADKRWEREKAGAKPQSQSDRRNKPWEAMGISESTWRRRKRAAKKAANEAVTAFRQPSSSYSSSTDCGHNPEAAPCGRLCAIDPEPRFERDAPAVPQSPPRQAPSSLDQQQPEAIVSEVSHSAEPISRSSAASQLRDAHLERNELLKMGPPDAGRGQRLAQLDRIIETARHQLEQRR